MVLGTFFPQLPRGVRACQDGMGHFFSTFARLTEGGGLKLFGQCPYRTKIFQKGASLKAEQPKCNKSRERRAVAAARDQIRNNSVSGHQQFLQTVKLSIKSVALEFAKSVGSSVLRLWLLATKPGNLC